MPCEDRARELLREALPGGHDFRPGQLQAIVALVEERRRVLLVQRTGWGKSLVYFIATRLLRDSGTGPTILISPLLSLMRDQLRMAEALGVSARRITHENQDEWDQIDAELQADQVDLLLVSPERLSASRFREVTLHAIQGAIGMLVVDEAHCISDWGHDFRPNYRRIRNLVAQLPPNVPLLATTATANDRVVADVEEQFGPNLSVIRGPLARESLRLQAIPLADQAERLAWLAANVPHFAGSGIIYCLTIADCERVADWLTSQGIAVKPYHGELDNDVRVELEDELRGNRVKALAATVSLGMGFDKPDLGFIVHYQRPGSVVTYYQQIGRAGRAVDSADVVLLAGREDDQIEDYFIRGAFPPENVLQLVLNEIAQAPAGLRLVQLERVANISQGQLKHVLKVLELESAIFKDGPAYVRTVNAWRPDSERIRGVTAQRERERQRMREYVEARTCLMEFLQVDLDDPTAAPCGRCAVCDGDFVSRDVDPQLVLEAVRFLRRLNRPIAPRKRWPNGGAAGRRGAIPEGEQAEPGRALSIYGDAGWGRFVRDAKYLDERFGDDLVEAAAALIRDEWQPQPPPTWLVPMPSLRSDIVADFSERLAAALGIEFREALRKVRDTPPQKTMQNSQQQLSNVAGAFEVVTDQVSPDPGLIVDDVVDSRWSITECVRLLRLAGSGPLFPFALADSSRSGD